MSSLVPNLDNHNMTTYTFHDQQIATAERILSAFSSGEGQLYGILLAQMQSGKSGTYYRIALECINRKLFDSVYIICGSRDTALHQTKEGLWRPPTHFVTRKA